MQYTFQPQKWYFIAIEHASAGGSLFSRTDSEARLYVDGRLSESHALELPRVAKPLAFCCIGTNPPAAMAGLQRKRRQCPLFAEMGPIYIFKEPVGPEKMARLARRGGEGYFSWRGLDVGVCNRMGLVQSVRGS